MSTSSEKKEKTFPCTGRRSTNWDTHSTPDGPKIVIYKNSAQFFAFHKKYISYSMLEDSTAIRAKQKDPFYSIQKIASHLKANSLTLQLYIEGFLPLLHLKPASVHLAWEHSDESICFKLAHLSISTLWLLSFLGTNSTQNRESSTLSNQLP